MDINTNTVKPEIAGCEGKTAENIHQLQHTAITADRTENQAQLSCLQDSKRLCGNSSSCA